VSWCENLDKKGNTQVSCRPCIITVERYDMLDTNEKIERLEKIIGEASESHPHSRDIIHAFAPFLLEKASLMGSLDFKDHRTMAMDELQFKNGVPLLRQNEFSPVTHACELIAMAILPPLETGFQKLYRSGKAEGRHHGKEDRVCRSPRLFA